MGQKKDTLLRWVNCCSDAATTIERIKDLADGWFFIHILKFLRSHPTDSNDPWLQTVNILKEYKLQENVVDFHAAASGNEDELAKLIVICMHLTMVQKPCDHIKEKTMWNLSTEDQRVIEAILLAIVNDDQLTRNRLIDVLQDNLLQENSFTKSVMFYTSSPLSSLSSMKNSPLKRFLDSPMALRLTRLQKELSDKNEEIRRLQSELMTESDESSALSLRMDDLKRKVKDLEKKNTDLEQRLRDFQLPESSGPETDVEITQLKKKLKKMQSEYEASCQKYCDLNIEYEAMNTRQEKDRKQIRQLQLDLNDTVSRFERESAEYQLLLDSIRTENTELKHSLEEKAQWIDVLEEKSRTCSEMHARLNAPRSPCERESIGYSLLSIETEKLQGDLESYRRDLARQSDQFDSEKRVFQQRASALEEDKRGLNRQVEQVNLENQSLQVQLNQAKANLEQLSISCDSLGQEKEELRRSLEELQLEFHKEVNQAQEQLDIRNQKSLELGLLIETLNQQLEETQAAKMAFEQSIYVLTEEKLVLSQSVGALEQSHLDLKSTLSANQSKFNHELEEVSNQLKLSTLQIAGQSHKVTDLEEQLDGLRKELETKEESCAILETEKQQICEALGQQISALQSDFKISKEEFQLRLDNASIELESATSRITDLCEVTSSLKAQLEVAIRDKEESENRSSQLEVDLNKLFQQRDDLQVEVQQLLYATQISQEEFQKLEGDLDSYRRDLANQSDQFDSEKRIFQERVDSLEDDKRGLNRQVEQVNLENQSLQVQLDQAKANLEQLSIGCDSLGQEKEELRRSLEESQLEFHKEVNRAQEQLDIRNQKSLELGLRIDTLNQQLEETQAARMAFEQSIYVLTEEKLVLSQSVGALKQSHLDLQSTLSANQSKFNHELEEVSNQLKSSTLQVAGQSHKVTELEEQLDCLRKELETKEKSCLILETEKQQLCEAKFFLEQQISALQSDCKMSKQELQMRLDKANMELESATTRMNDFCETTLSLKAQLEIAMHDKEESENRSSQLEVNLNTLFQQRDDLQLEVQQLLYEAQISREEFQKLKDDCTKLESEREAAVEEKNQLTNEMLVLQAVQGEMRNLEVAMEQLTSEIQELSSKKANLERLREILEDAKVAAEEESRQLRREVESKNLEITQLVEKVEFTESQLERSTQDQILLHTLKLQIENIVKEKDEQGKHSGDQISTLNSQKETLLAKNASIELENQELKSKIAAEIASKNLEITQLVEFTESQLEQSTQDKRLLHTLKLQIENIAKEKDEQGKHLGDQISTLNSQKETLLEKNASIERENQELKSKIAAEIASKNLEITQLVEKFKFTESQLEQSTQDKILLHTLKLKIETIVQEKDEQGKHLGDQILTLNSQKEALQAKNISVERENQELKSKIAAETAKNLGKGEIMLEHRKEKAALEARLLVAQSQMKSMQEKLVNMTVANNSHAPLEHKVSMLTNELEAVNKAKSELEKLLDDSMSVRTKEETLSVKKEELIESHFSKPSESHAEISFLRKKYDNAKKELNRTEEVINQYAVKFEKMQNQLDNLNEEVGSLNMDKKKLAFENRSLKTEQNHLLAQISSEKDKANARNTRHSLALQRGNAASNASKFLQSTRNATTNFLTNLSGGTLADCMIDARRRSMRPTRSEVAVSSRERQAPTEVFRAPELAFGDGSDTNSIFKIPPSRRDSTSSVCSNRSDISTTSRGTNVPQGAGRLFTCDDEDGECFSSSYLNEMKEGKCQVDDSSTRVSELLRRNTMQPPHMRSAYPIEMNDERLRQNNLNIYDQPKATSSRADNHNTLQQLSYATSMLSMNTPPAMNTRKRRSSSWNPTDMETPVMQPRKRRSYELDADLSSDSTDTRSIVSSAERKKHRDASLTSYSRPGPPTPARNPAKENISTPSTSSSPPKATKSAKAGSKRTSPHGTKNLKSTPVGLLVKKVQAKFRSNMQASSEQNTPSSTRTTPRGSKLTIFRKPLGSRSYNSDAKM